MQLCTKGKVQPASQKGPNLIFRKHSNILFPTNSVVPVRAQEELHIGAGVDAGDRRA